MKSFTAKDFSRCPAKVYEAAREEGKVEVTHDRFLGAFILYYDGAGSKAVMDLGKVMVEDMKNLMTHDPYKAGDYLAINKKDEKDKNKKWAKEISGEDWIGWRDLLHILSDNINEFEDDAIKRLVLLINKKAPD